MQVNLKEDLTKLAQSKLHYAKVNLARLAGTADGNMSYEDRLNELMNTLHEIVIADAVLGTIPMYFQDVPQQQQQPISSGAPVQQQQPNGPTHAE